MVYNEMGWGGVWSSRMGNKVSERTVGVADKEMRWKK